MENSEHADLGSLRGVSSFVSTRSSQKISSKSSLKYTTIWCVGIIGSSETSRLQLRKMSANLEAPKSPSLMENLRNKKTHTQWMPRIPPQEISTALLRDRGLSPSVTSFAACPFDRKQQPYPSCGCKFLVPYYNWGWVGFTGVKKSHVQPTKAPLLCNS